MLWIHLFSAILLVGGFFCILLVVLPFSRSIAQTCSISIGRYSREPYTDASALPSYVLAGELQGQMLAVGG
jgi:uncharacterized membrane protein